MSLKLMSLSFHVPVFMTLMSIKVMSLYFMSLKQFHVPQIDVPFNPCFYISSPITNSMSIKLASLSFHVPEFDVPGVSQFNIPFIPYPCI